MTTRAGEEEESRDCSTSRPLGLQAGGEFVLGRVRLGHGREQLAPGDAKGAQHGQQLAYDRAVSMAGGQGRSEYPDFGVGGPDLV